eukprot:784324_1
MSAKMESKPKYYQSLITSLSKAGYINVTKLADSLQGGVYKALKKSLNAPVVIKMTNKMLHKRQIALLQGKQYYNIQENILQEASILKYLTQQKDLPKSIVKFSNFLTCNNYYYLIMSDGGESLFSFVKQA